MECYHKTTKLLKVSETRAAVFLTDGAILKSLAFFLLPLLIFILTNLI